MNIEQRLRMLEDQMLVMQREISEVLGETQAALAGLAKTLKITTEVFDRRLRVLEGTNFVTLHQPTAEPPQPTDPEASGKEL